MAKVHKTVEEARKHLGEAAGMIPARYKEAVAKADWETNAASDAAESNYAAGVGEAIALKSRAIGVSRAGNAKWRKGAIDKGGAVIGTRITAALGEYAREFAPILSAMNSASDAAPPRTRDAMANIDARLKPVVMAAIAAKK